METRTRQQSGKPPQKEKKKRRFNGWKYAFLLLVALILATVGVTVYRLSSVREPNLPDMSNVQFQGQPVAQLTTNKEKVNMLINQVLQEHSTGQMNYTFHIENRGILSGTHEFLGFPITFDLYFEPTALQDGNIQLKVTSLSAGTLALPTGVILEAIRGLFTFPEYVVLDTESDTITIRLDMIQLSENMQIRATMIDLVNDRFEFDIYLR